MNVILALGGTLLMAGMAAVVAGIGALAFGRRKDVYLYGVGAMTAAFVASMLVLVVVGVVLPSFPTLWFIILIGPAIEEGARIAAIILVSPALQKRRDWVIFGLGFALVETLFKIAGWLARGANGDFLLFGVLTPLVPLLLHIFLSVAAIALYRRRKKLVSVLLVTFVLHALHNASIAFGWWTYEAGAAAYVGLVLKCALYIALISLILRASARLERVTSSPPHANSVP